MFPRLPLLVIWLLFAGASPSRLTLDDKVTFNIPYPTEETVVLRWEYQGKRCGETSFTLKRLPDQSRIQVDAQLVYARPGTRIRMTGQTLFLEDLKPVEYRGQKHLGTAIGLNATTVSARFDKSRVVVSLDSHRKKTQEFALEEPTYLFESQAMEHWALLATVLQKRGPGRYTLFMPTDFRKLEFRFDKLEKVETPRGDAWLWSGFHPSMQVKLWITPEGILTRYQQGDLNILLASELPAQKSEEGKK